ncbi:MAG: UPF0149 family protein [Acidiferrobacter sp.]
MAASLSFTSLQEHLAAAAIPISAAEAHGAITGLLCGGLDSDETAAGVLGDPGDDPGFPGVLATAREQVRGQLEDGEFAFTPLLPPDDTPLVQRIDMLTRWCAGFIAGFSRAPPDDIASGEGEGEGAEFLADVTALADAAGTVGEADYAEIIEYLRVGVQILYEERMSGGA